MRLLKLFALLATVTAAAAVEAGAGLSSDPARPQYTLRVALEPAEGAPDKGFGVLKFRQPIDAEKIIYLDVRVRGLLPNHSYELQRAVDMDEPDDQCKSSDWLTLGKGLEPEEIATDDKGAGRAALFRDISAVPTGKTFDIHFRVRDAITEGVVLQSVCYQYTVRQ